MKASELDKKFADFKWSFAKTNEVIYSELKHEDRKIHT